jgi:DNA-directed RNA polymerase subunit RPC12/RpoP
MSSEIKEATVNGTPSVFYCCSCGAEFTEAALTMQWTKCGYCGKLIQCRVKDSPQE